MVISKRQTELVLFLVVILLRDISALSYSQADEFLRQYMPLRDRLGLSEDFISNNIRQALRTQSERVWAEQIPAEIFLDYVLPYSRQGDLPIKTAIWLLQMCDLLPCAMIFSGEFADFQNPFAVQLRSSGMQHGRR